MEGEQVSYHNNFREPFTFFIIWVLKIEQNVCTYRKNGHVSQADENGYKNVHHNRTSCVK